MARGGNGMDRDVEFSHSSLLARAVLGAGVSVTEQPGDFVILPRSALNEISWLRVAYRLAYALCFGAGCGLTLFLLNRMFTTAAMLAFNF
jgi:hypothetical protein